MAEFEEKLNEILSSPEAMGQIMALASSLSGAQGVEGGGAAPPEDAPSPSEAGSGGAPEGLEGLLGALDPGTLRRLLRLAGELRSGGDERTRLLEALRPFLRPERQARLERAIQLARLTRVLRSALGLLGEGADV